MRILQLTPRLPYPPTDGGRVVMLQIAQALQRIGAAVSVLSLNPLKHHSDLEVMRRALVPAVVDAVDADTSVRLGVIARSMRSSTPLIVARFYSPAFASRLRAMLRDGVYDVVQIESPFLLPYLPLIRETSNAAVVLRTHNIEFHVWEHLAAHGKTVLRRLAYRAVARTVRRYEIAHLNVCDALLAISEDDAREFRALGCTIPMHVLPAGVDVAPVHVNDDRRGGRTGSVAFIGSLDYRPNQEAALWIAEELRPHLLRMEPAARIHIAGSRAPQWLRARLIAAGVIFEGEVRDAASFLAPMDVVVAPVFSGSGVRVKILEAMASGKAVVATPLGASSIGVSDRENIILAGEAESFARAVSHLLRDPERASEIGAAARTFVESRYATVALARDLLEFYATLTHSTSAAGQR